MQHPPSEGLSSLSLFYLDLPILLGEQVFLLASYQRKTALQKSPQINTGGIQFS